MGGLEQAFFFFWGGAASFILGHRSPWCVSVDFFFFVDRLGSVFIPHAPQNLQSLHRRPSNSTYSAL